MIKKYVNKYKESALNEMKNDVEVRAINVKIDASLYKKLHLKLIENDLTISDWIRFNIEKYIKSNK